jgi:c-di-GMP-binding flagellar brake protein YcgR
LLGFEANEFLVIKFSEQLNWLEFDRHCFPGAMMIVRMLIENERGECIAFNSEVRWVAQHPFKLLYLDFPKKIEKADLRLYPRVRTALSAKLSNVSNKPIEGVLEDVSLGGCCFTFNLPKGKASVAMGQVTVTAGKQFFMKADVCNQRLGKQGKLSVGLSFASDITDVMRGLNRLNIAKEPLLDGAYTLQ